MKSIKNLGIASIISSFLIGCSSPNILTKTFQKEKSDESKILSVHEDFGRMEFVPGRVYELNNSLKGNYVITLHPSSKDFPRASVTYFTSTGRIYQQALFSYDPRRRIMVANVVEIDWDVNGKRDMLLHYDSSVEKLIIVDQNKSSSHLMNAYFSEKTLNEYFTSSAYIDYKK